MSDPTKSPTERTCHCSVRKQADVVRGKRRQSPFYIASARIQGYGIPSIVVQLKSIEICGPQD